MLASGPSSVVQHIRAGKLRALAHWGIHPLASLPEVPSLTDRGFNVQYVQWSGIFVGAETPPAAVQRLREAVRKIANDPSVQQTVLRAGSPIEYLDAPEFADYWQKDVQAMATVVKLIGRVE